MDSKIIEGYLELKDVFVLEDKGKKYAFYTWPNVPRVDALSVLYEEYIDFAQISHETIDGLTYWKAPLMDKH